MSVNKVILVGNLGQNPEIRSTSDGRELINLSIATTETWKDKATGERKDKTEWHRVVVFSQGLVEIIKKGVAEHWIKKGSKIYLEGQLQTRKWTDNNGVDKYSTEIILQGFSCKFLVLSQQPKNENRSAEDTIKEAFQGAKAVDEFEGEDIPF